MANPNPLIGAAPKTTALFDKNGRMTDPWLAWLASITSAGAVVTSNGVLAAGALQAGNDLSELTATAGAARTNLGLGSAALHAASDFDVSGAAAAVLASSLQKTANLSDLVSPATARTNLGLGSAATHAATDFDLAGAAAAAQAAAIAASDTAGAAAAVLASSLQKASNLSDVANVVTTRTNLGLTAAAVATPAALTEATSAVLTITGGASALLAATSIQVAKATASVAGYLAAADFTTFNAKQAALTLPLSVANGGTGAVSFAAASLPTLAGTNTFAASCTFNSSVLVVAGGFTATLTSNACEFNRVGNSFIDQLGLAGSLVFRVSVASGGDTTALTISTTAITAALPVTVGTLRIVASTNTKTGSGTLAAGTVTISNTSVTANSKIFVTPTSNSANSGALAVTTKTAGTSFVVKSSNALDTAGFDYFIIET